MSDGPTVVEAHAFVLKDKDGQTVGSFGTNQDGEPLLMFADKKGRARIAMGFTADEECRFIMFDDEGNTRVNLGFLPTGQAAIMVMGKPGQPSAGIRGGYDEGVGLVAFGGSGKPRASMGIDGEGFPHCIILNPDGSVIFNAVRPTGEGETPGGIIVPKMPSPPSLPPEIQE